MSCSQCIRYEKKRLLRLQDDYDFKVTLTSLPSEVAVRIQVPDVDHSEMRAIQEKQLETGFVTVSELMRLQKAGLFIRCVDHLQSD